MTEPFVIYCLRGNDGSFYYGSTTKTIKKRLSDHKSRAKQMTEMKVYKHFNTIGWENVSVEEVQSSVGDKKARVQLENTYIVPRLNDPHCLNSKCSSLTPEEKKEHWKIASQKHDMKYKEKRNQRCRDYYYRTKYGMTEQEYLEKLGK